MGNKKLRISGGIYQGHTILCPPGIIRPANQRMRESFFTKLTHAGYLKDAHVYDLFGGSAIMALEAMSRGAKHATIVEVDAGKRDCLQQNIALVHAHCTVVIMSAERFIIQNNHSADIIFADPPFAYQHTADLLKKISASRIVHEGSIIALHVPRQESARLQKNIYHAKWHLELHTVLPYGIAHMLLYTVTVPPHIRI